MNLYINSFELILMHKIMIFQLKLVKYTIALFNQLKYQPKKSGWNNINTTLFIY